MVDLVRSRDCVPIFKGDCLPVSIDDALATAGWVGGQGVKWTTSQRDELMVTASDGLCCGFLLWGSDEEADQWVSSTGVQPHYKTAVLGVGGWHIYTVAYEKYTWASRQGGPLVPQVYHPSDRLVFSNRGLWTTEDEFSLSGDPRAPNNYYLGFVSHAPSPLTSNTLGVQTSI